MTQGGTADIPITAFDVPNPGAAAFTLTITFDQRVIEVVDVLPGDAPFGGFLTVNTAEGVVAITDLHGRDGVTGDIVLARLRINAVATSGNTNLSLTIVSFIYVNAANIVAKAVHGSVNIE